MEKSTIPIMAAACLLSFCCNLRAAETPASTRPVAIGTRDGCRLNGLLSCAGSVWIRCEGGGRQAAAWERVARIAFAERIDPNEENAARNAIDDLRSNQFKTREKALSQLRKLGRAALRPLNEAVRSADAEEAARARTLLAELDAARQAEQLSDELVLDDKTSLRGRIECDTLTVRTRWGRFELPVERLAYVETLPAREVNAARLAPVDAPLRVTPQVSQEKLAGTAERWDPALEAGQAAEANPEMKAKPALARGLTMQSVPDPKTAAGKRPRVLPAKPGQRLDDAYAPWGVHLRGVGEDSTVEATNDGIFSDSGGLAAEVKQGACDVLFCTPGVSRANDSPGGVTAIGAIVKADGAGSIGLAAFDRHGRQLVEVLNRNDSNRIAGGAQRDEFLGVRSKVPIVRARFFRVKDPQAPLVFDDLVFDRIVAPGVGAGQSVLWLRTGEILAGTLQETRTPEAVSLKLALDPEAAPVELGLDELVRYDPGQSGGNGRRVSQTPHAVLLQNGESFRACLLKLDENNAVFRLPGGAELALPRLSLRKIDLQPDSANGQASGASLAVGADEKPGVILKPKPNASADAKDDTRIENVEVVSVNAANAEVIVRDEGNDMTVGLPLIRALVFAPAKAPREGPGLRDWSVTLREGSRFDVALQAITPAGIRAEMAGGCVVLPVQVIDSVQRK